ncbi:MAG: DNA gyrase subunit A [Holosporales bacterium]|nr:DNA gyrase subunit A [Holosporales bacterium]
MATETEDKDVTLAPLDAEMKRSYLDYAMSVIVARALPDVRDGLKPVHRRILYGMKEGGCDYNKPYRKSARIVGDVMGKYHPHGDAPIYDSMVRMAQDFSMRSPLIDGQGNFGSMDGDSAAAMRYTEARLSKISHSVFEDLDFDTVDFQPNYDGSTVEPRLMPARFPNLLVNGAGGIAVGMATNIPTHNLGEVIDACHVVIDNPDVDVSELIKIIPGPDFPTGASIIGRSGIYSYFSCGRGAVTVRSKTHVEEIRSGKFAIIATEIPYQVNKARLVEHIAEIVNDKTVEGISDLRDESDREGVRVVIELKRDASPEVILNQLYRHTQLQVSFGVNMLALHNGLPVQMGLKEVLVAFLSFRREVVVRRTQFELNKARDRAHLLIGLALAVANIDEVVALIKSSQDAQDAKQRLLSRKWAVTDVLDLIKLIDDAGNVVENGICQLTERQAQAILDLRLQRLTGLERTKIDDELKALIKSIADLLDILASPARVTQIIKDELTLIKDNFADKRRTSIEEGEIDIDDEDLIEREDVVITVSEAGYIKRVPLAQYKLQKRGGKGRAGIAMRDEDFAQDIFLANTHTPVLFFSSKGIVYQAKAYTLPQGTLQSRGKAMVNMFPLSDGETISTVLVLPKDEDCWESLNIIFATSKGNVRRNKMADFLKIRTNGRIAMKLDEGEQLISVAACKDNVDVMLATYKGMCVRFPIDALRVFAGHGSNGVRGVRLKKDDHVISMTIINSFPATTEERDDYIRYYNWSRRVEGDSESESESDREPEIATSKDKIDLMMVNDQSILTVTERGFGKRTSSYAYRTTSRGVQGIKNIEVSPKNGCVVATFPVNDDDHIMLITDQGKLIRSAVTDIRITGRNTRGVIVFRIDPNEKVVSAIKLNEFDEGEDEPVQCE